MQTEYQQEASCQYRAGHMLGVEGASHRLLFRTAIRYSVLQTIDRVGRYKLTANSLT